MIFSISNGYRLWGRPSLDDLRRDLREVARTIRPDQELGASGLHENWDADKQLHQPSTARSTNGAGSACTMRA